MATTTITIPKKKIIKKTEENSVSGIVKGMKSFDTLSAAIKMITSPEEIKQIAQGLSPEQYDILIDQMATVDTQLAEWDKKAKEMEKTVSHIRSFMLDAMKEKQMKNIMTANKNIAEVQAGRATSEFTVTVHEFIKLAQDAGHSSEIDKMVSIKKTAAEEFLGKSLVNKITKQTKEEYGKVKFSKF